jgi:hypothetical protein
VPIVSLFADVGLVIAMRADGGIVEGRHTATTDAVSNTLRVSEA